MIQVINFSMFCDAFFGDYKNNFSYAGKRALFDYLEELEDITEQVELDIVELCCEYSEYDNAMEAAKEYGYEEGVDLEEHGGVDLLEVSELENRQAIEWLQDRTQVIEFDGGIIIQQF